MNEITVHFLSGNTYGYTSEEFIEIFMDDKGTYRRAGEIDGEGEKGSSWAAFVASHESERHFEDLELWEC